VYLISIYIISVEVQKKYTAGVEASVESNRNSYTTCHAKTESNCDAEFIAELSHCTSNAPTRQCKGLSELGGCFHTVKLMDEAPMLNLLILN
jgi:hypothetical protein